MEPLVEKRVLPQRLSNSDSQRTSEITMTIAPRVYEEAIRRMGELFSRIELDRDVIIPQHVRSFLSGIALESLHLRRDEWRQLCKVDPGMDAHAAPIGNQIYDSLLEIMRNAGAEPSAPNDIRQVTLVAVLRCVHENWCRIFPFCRR
jgi:hypothetical protein